MAAALKHNTKSKDAIYAGYGIPLILPSWLIIGFFLVVPVGIMFIYSFLT